MSNKIAPGRARITAKFRLSTMSADITGAHVSEDCAIGVQDMLLSGRLAPGVLHAVAAERKKQDAQWGGPSHDDTHYGEDWRCYIRKQLAAMNDHNFEARQRFVKIAALAVAAVESIDRRAVLGNDGKRA